MGVRFARVALVVLGCGCDHVLGLNAIPKDAPPPMYTLVQQQTMANALTSDLAVTLPNEPTPGDLLVMVGAGNLSFLDQVSGGAPSWSLAARAEGYDLEVWFGVVDPTQTSATVTICYALQGGPPGPMWMSVTEWTGVSPTNPLDAAQPAMNTPPEAAVVGPLVVTGPDLLIFAEVSNSPPAGEPTGAQWTALDGPSLSSFVQDEWYATLDGAAEVDASVDLMSCGWAAALAAFRPGA